MTRAEINKREERTIDQEARAIAKRNRAELEDQVARLERRLRRCSKHREHLAATLSGVLFGRVKPAAALAVLDKVRQDQGLI